MTGWNHLTEDQKRQFARNLVQRRASYETWHKFGEIAVAKDILLIADRPGPGAPDTDNYHHTPFYAKTHSGGWLNANLVEACIPETRLFWENSANRHGQPMDPRILSIRPWRKIFMLGNNAETWIRKNLEHVSLAHDGDMKKVLHPQAHKRWNSKAPYDLIAELQILHMAPYPS